MTTVFQRPHHQRIARVLTSLDSALLQEHRCWFGGGTAIALRHSEYRESVDIDFLVSELTHYRELRQMLTGSRGLAALTQDRPAWESRGEVRADQYGIRTALLVGESSIKFEIVLEGRIELALPGEQDQVCGIATLSALDLVASKLLANSDRWADDGVFGRDALDLAMMQPDLALLRRAVTKAEQAYGTAILRDLCKAIHRLRTRDGWLERCMQALAFNVPRAVVLHRLRALTRILEP